MNVTKLNNASEDDIVLVPVPKRLLPRVYRTLAQAMGDDNYTSGQAFAGALEGSSPMRHNMIDLIIRAANDLGATRHSVTLGDLHSAYLSMFPGIGKGVTRDGFSATLNYHCINMRSRFPAPKDRRRPASWLTQPAFKRVGYGRYMLLSEEEIVRFRRCVEEDIPMVYADEYDVDDLSLED